MAFHVLIAPQADAALCWPEALLPAEPVGFAFPEQMSALNHTMTTTIADPPEEPGSKATAITFCPDPTAFSTEKYFIAQCDVGWGVFAKRDIDAKEIILEIDGPQIDFAETKRRGPRECMAIQIGYNKYIDTQPPGVLVNHSCSPNSGIRDNRYLVALRMIRRGEEIRYDYSTTMEEQSFTMECRCGARSCRKVIRDFSTLPADVQQAYIAEKIVMGFILRRPPLAR